MKELSIEEKARRYDEAIKKVNDYYEGKTKLYSDVDKTLDYLFPALKESEDEKMKREILELVSIAGDGNQFEEIKDWLEKQGEQKPHDTPKFHEGEWIIDKQGIVHQIANVIENVTNHTYGYDIVGGGYFNDNTEGVRLWTIQDAKDGDILASDNGVIILVKESRNSLWGYRLSYHCAVLYDGTFEHREFHVNPEKFFPATKEQRELFFQKMKEAGYEWDTDKKELKKIEQEYHCTGVRKPKEATGVLKQLLNKENYAWSEEDTTTISRVISIVKWAAYSDHSHPILNDEGATELVERLKSIKDRVQPQPKQEWSEEDKVKINRTVAFLENLNLENLKVAGNDILLKDIEWLKSLKDRYAWRPSEEQM